MEDGQPNKSAQPQIERGSNKIGCCTSGVEALRNLDWLSCSADEMSEYLFQARASGAAATKGPERRTVDTVLAVAWFLPDPAATIGPQSQFGLCLS